MAALTARGHTVAPFKVGPDFIDPGHHSRITGRVSRNLDGWMLSQAYNLDSFARHTADADIAVVEGVMGLFDGYDGRSEAGSTAQMAKWLGLPVVLVVGARSMARSAAALVQGFEGFDDALSFAGVLFNHLGSDRHLTYLKEAMDGHVRMPVLGGLMRDESHRHSRTASGAGDPRGSCDLSAENRTRLAGLIENRLDLDALLRMLPDVDLKEGASTPANEGDTGCRPHRGGPGCRLLLLLCGQPGTAGGLRRPAGFFLSPQRRPSARRSRWALFRGRVPGTARRGSGRQPITAAPDPATEPEKYAHLR